MKIYNPYYVLGEKQKEALDFIIANLPPSPTFEQLNEVLLTAVFGIAPDGVLSSDTAPLFLQTVLPLAHNGYINGAGKTLAFKNSSTSEGSNTTPMYTERQMPNIRQMLDGIQSVPAESIVAVLNAAEETIAGSGLAYQEQLPLYIAVEAGRSQAAYWLMQINTPGAWAVYQNTDAAINYLHMPQLISAAVRATLLCYGLIKPAQVTVPDVFPAMVGSIGLAAGKVIFGWVPM
jgi:hypothetical protein